MKLRFGPWWTLIYNENKFGARCKKREEGRLN